MLADAPGQSPSTIESSTAEFSLAELDISAFKKRKFKKVFLFHSTADADSYVVEADRVIESPPTVFETVVVSAPDAQSVALCLGAAKLVSDELGWSAEWELVDGVVTARYDESARELVASTGFDFYAQLSAQLGAAVVQAHSFDLHSGNEA